MDPMTYVRTRGGIPGGRHTTVGGVPRGRPATAFDY
ncbi:hypothetical protein COLO4_19931 [Corchorus olitorius]|uniref:Uncharacterized protein n=1 Tax=Corchorus olitorius TaxID=93759 RepID=A0A1R3J2R3_9ROSI|nr:hypothetical protein COLO4_19931 [Corchorus olitorius]